MATLTLSDDTLDHLLHAVNVAATHYSGKLAKAKRATDQKRYRTQLAQMRDLQVFFGDRLPETPAPTDVTATNHGSVFHFTLHTLAVREFVPTQFAVADYQWLGGHAFAVDHRFAPQIVCVLRDHGFHVEVR